MPQVAEISPVEPSTDGTPPDVPTLVLEGALDFLTPGSDAEAAATRFPQAQALTVPDAGHAVAFSAESERCVQAALTRFLAHRRIQLCTPVRPAVATSPLAPTAVAALRPWPRVPGLAGKTLRAVVETVDDVELTHRSRGPRTGLRGGTFAVHAGSLKLDGVVYVPDVVVSGKYTPRSRTARLRVIGAGASGTIVFHRSGRISGTLAGRPLAKGVHL